MINLRSFWCGICLLLCCAHGFAQDTEASRVQSSSGASTTQTVSQAPLSWLFMLNADDVKLTNTNNQLQLHIPARKIKITAFADRPYRAVHSITADRFLKFWQPEGTFSKDSPNAVVYLDGKHAIITITNVERQGQYLIATIQPDTKNSPDTLSVTDDAYLGMVIDNASSSGCCPCKNGRQATDCPSTYRSPMNCIVMC